MMESTSADITILLIGHNPDDVLFIQHLLAQSSSERFVCNLLQVDSLANGLMLIEQQAITTIFLSAQLIKHQDQSVVSTLLTANPEIPIVICATQETESNALSAIYRGADSYILLEDLNSNELERTIRCYAAHYRRRNKLEIFTQHIQNSHARLYSIIGKSADGIIILDTLGTILFVNPAAARLLCREADALLGETLDIPLVPGTTTEITIECQNGCTRIIELRTEDIVWEHKPAGITTIRDISERKQTEKALHESEQRYKTLLSSVTDYIYTVEIVDGHAERTIHSPNCVAVTGYTTEEYKNNTYLWYSMVYNDDRAIVTERASHVVAGQQVPPLEHRIMHKDGSIRWVKNTYVPRYNQHGQLVAYDGLVTDITERRLAEEEVHRLNAELEQRVIERTAQLEATNKELQTEINERKRVEEELRKLSRAVEQSPAAIVITDTQGIIEYVNPRFTQVTGYTFKEAIGKKPRILKSGTMPASIYQQLWETIVAGHEWRGELHNRKKNGDLYWEFASISPIVNAQGTATHFLAIKEDITDRKQAEEDLRQAQLAAETATQAKSTFLANMSHEIRTPLNAIIGMTTLLINSDLPDEQRDYVETISICGESLLDIINDVLDFSKIEAGKLELEYTPFILYECLEESLDVVSSKAVEKQLEVIYDFDNRVPLSLIGDPARLRQILVNLLSNAIKFTEQGEVVVTVSVVDEHTAEDEESHITLHVCVRDTGIGIRDDHLARLFQTFNQVDTTVARRYGGTGLGLAISKRLAELMGGTMWAESTYGHGSLFHFTIKATPVETSTHPDLTTIQPELVDKRVLVVRTNTTACNALIHRLTTWGMHTYATTNTTEFLHQMPAQDHEHYDVAIIDNVSNLDSLQLVEHIRACPGCQTTPLIFLTSAGTRRTFTQTTGLTDVWFLQKPVKISRLRDMLVDSVQHNRQQHGKTVNQSVLPNLPFIAKEHPLSILVAEDNIFNQKVILLLLERMGYQADMVSNGSQVLRALELRLYDVIFMDIQMPEMGGIEATQMIRARLKESRQPHIIAMTAHTLSGDREQCLEAGMNNYISKPVRMDALVHALWQARKRSSSAPPQSTNTIVHISDAAAFSQMYQQGYASTNESDAVHQPIDISILRSLQVELGEDNVDTLNELLTIFLDNTPVLVMELHQALASHSFEAMQRAAHTLKSSSAQIGATTLSTLCQSLEYQVQAGNDEHVEQHIQDIENEFMHVQEFLVAFLSG